jgi:hypothetical protein
MARIEALDPQRTAFVAEPILVEVLVPLGLAVVGVPVLVEVLIVEPTFLWVPV